MRVSINGRALMRIYWAREIKRYKDDDDVREGAEKWLLERYAVATA